MPIATPEQASAYLRAAVLSTPIGAIIGSCITSGWFMYLEKDSGLGHFFGNVAAMSLYGFLIAAVVVLLYGLPLYVLLSRLHLASLPMAVLFGGLPGFLWVQSSHDHSGDAALVFGVTIAVLFHFIASRRANSRLKPTAPPPPFGSGGSAA